MKLEIKNIYSSDFDADIAECRPEELDNFGLWFCISIGPAGTEAADNYQLLVCTPTWLSAYVEHEKDFAAWGRHMLIVSEFNADRIGASIERLLSRCCGADWQTIALKFSRFAAWEFEDYQERAITHAEAVSPPSLCCRLKKIVLKGGWLTQKRSGRKHD
ncbi:immunity 8 family protein [Paraburkholderia sp. D1E]|uniref:immunity 8 family protein n=1 Tax=Paraburkholderia sp. D1E TaxID=3461398 RepID=UPI0040453A05